jgi:hypothetical protein
VSLPPNLAESLARLSEALEALKDDWWLIGSAAMALHGARPITVADVDLLASPADAIRLAKLWGITPPSPAPDPRFRSEVYFQWPEPPVPVDVMGGFEVKAAEGWRPLRPRTRVAVPSGGYVFHTPSLAEQIEILQLFGRPKDLMRAALLRGLV